ncbi:2623_t:CDS:2, partial [Dentiscutata heterogama]
LQKTPENMQTKPQHLIKAMDLDPLFPTGDSKCNKRKSKTTRKSLNKNASRRVRPSKKHFDAGVKGPTIEF